MQNAEYWINKLNLLPHPEGGYYKQIYKSNEEILKAGLPKRYKSNRSFLTSIYYLLENNHISKFHKLKSDEIWYYHLGNPVKAHIFNEKGLYSENVLGKQIDKNQSPQVIFLKNSWFAAEVIQGNDDYSLIGCAVAPGFEFEDFELGKRENLQLKFPEYSELIDKFS